MSSFIRDNDPKTFFWRQCGNYFLSKRKAPVELIRIKYFFQSMDYNPIEWIKDLQDYSSEWKKELKWQLMVAFRYENKEIWRDSDWCALRQLQEKTVIAPKNN